MAEEGWGVGGFVNNLTWSLACGEHAEEEEQQGCGGHPVSERGSCLTRYHSIAHLSALLVQQERILSGWTYRQKHTLITTQYLVY